MVSVSLQKNRPEMLFYLKRGGWIGWAVTIYFLLCIPPYVVPH